MPLTVHLNVTTGGDDAGIETLVVSRLTRLAGGDPRDQRHEYSAVRYALDGTPRARAQFRHRYGDGAWMCVMRALMALTLSGHDGAAIHEVESFGFTIDEEEAP